MTDDEKYKEAYRRYLQGELIDYPAELHLKDKHRNSIAHHQARTGRWWTMNEEILLLKNKEGCSVAYFLAKYNDSAFWAKDACCPHFPLTCRTPYGKSVAHELALRSDITGWTTQDLDLLELKDAQGTTVASILGISEKELAKLREW